MSRKLSPGEVLSRVQRCSTVLEGLRCEESARPAWLQVKEVISYEAWQIRPTSRAVACLLDTAAGAMGGFLLAPERNLNDIKGVVAAVLMIAESESTTAMVGARVDAVS